VGLKPHASTGEAKTKVVSMECELSRRREFFGAELFYCVVRLAYFSISG
jgi:hypothetical protein